MTAYSCKCCPERDIIQHQSSSSASPSASLLRRGPETSNFGPPPGDGSLKQKPKQWTPESDLVVSETRPGAFGEPMLLFDRTGKWVSLMPPAAEPLVCEDRPVQDEIQVHSSQDSMQLWFTGDGGDGPHVPPPQLVGSGPRHGHTAGHNKPFRRGFGHSSGEVDLGVLSSDGLPPNQR